MTATGQSRAWWKPPERFDQRTRTTLWGLLIASVVTGYFSILMVQTLTFTARSFGSGLREQGVALATVRVDFFVALAIVVFADRFGRQRVMLLAIVGAAIATAVSGLAPSFEFYTGSQVVAKGLVSAAVVLIGIISAEAAPDRARAYVLGLMTLAGALGAGVCVVLLSTVDATADAWRYLYVGALVSLPLVILMARWVPEPERFARRDTSVSLSGYWRPLLLLSTGAVLLTVFSTPAIEFKNDWLSQQRGYSAAEISLYNIVAYGPALFGVVAGGRLADRFGRKRVAVIGIAGAVVGGVASYLSYGWGVVAWSMLSGAFTGLAVAPLGVYRPELFPTALRAKANGVIGGASRIGAALGLVLAPIIAGGGESLGRGMAILALGPLLLIVLIITCYPETADQSLEDLHPVDRGPAS